jgi:putative methionine-R-sulfoxide reductase with GAF domain
MQPVGTKPAETSGDLRPIPHDRRRRIRHKVHTPAYASLNGDSSGRALDLSAILDISEEGMSIQTSSPLESDSSLNLCLDLSETQAYIHTDGHVVWSDSGRAGIRFPQMPDPSLRQLKQWLFLNAITGCVNATWQTPLPEPEPPKKTSEQVVGRFAVLREQEAYEPPAPPDYTSVLIALAAVQREVESIGPDLNPALQLVAERARTFTGATGAAIALSQGEEMICCATDGSDAPPLGARFQAGSGFSGECVRTSRLLACDDSETDPRVDPENCRALGIRSMVAVPVRLGDAVIGLLEVFSSGPGAFGANDHTVLQRLAETILAAVNRAAHASAAKAQALERPTPVVVEPPSFDVPDEAVTSDQSPSGSRRVLLIAVVATLLGVSLWLIAPSIKIWAGRSSQSRSQPTSKPQVALVKTPAATAADAGGFEGLRRLAEQGDPAAQFALGVHYATGEDVHQDYAEAFHWFSMAAEQGQVMAQATLGTYYWAGRGVPKDMSKAYFWTVVAQAGGDQTSKNYVSILTTGMSRAQILAEQQAANEWVKQHQSAGKNPPAP